METAMEKKAFKRGLNEVDAMPGKLGQKVRRELMIGLSLRSRQAFFARANGYVSHTPLEIEGVERIFTSYGCNSPWGM